MCTLYISTCSSSNKCDQNHHQHYDHWNCSVAERTITITIISGLLSILWHSFHTCCRLTCNSWKNSMSFFRLTVLRILFNVVTETSIDKIFWIMSTEKWLLPFKLITKFYIPSSISYQFQLSLISVSSLYFVMGICLRVTRDRNGGVSSHPMYI